MLASEQDRRETGALAGAWLDFIDPQGYIRFIIAIGQIVTGWYAISLETFLRRDFGERYYTVMRFFFGSTIVWGFNFIAPRILGQGVFSPLFYLIYVTYFVRGIWHLVGIQRRKWRMGKWATADDWFSFCQGISWGFWWKLPIIKNWDEGTVYRWAEPIGCIAIGILAWKLDPVTMLWLSISGMCLFFKNQIEYYYERSMYLNLIDGAIVYNQIENVMAGKKRRETQGYTMLAISTSRIPTAHRERIVEEVHMSDLRRMAREQRDDVINAIRETVQTVNQPPTSQT